MPYNNHRMVLIINGEQRETQAETVRQLLEQLGLGNQSVAVELNRRVVPRSAHNCTPLVEGDILEMVSLVGGG